MSARDLLASTATRTMATMFPGFFPGAKHNHYWDFGFPPNPQFEDFLAAYERQGLGYAAVEKTASKTWQDFPFLRERQRDAGEEINETRWERNIRQRFDDLRLWQNLREADVRGMVGAYAGVVLRFADGREFDQPVKRVRSGLAGLVEIIPAWEAQLTVAEWDNDQQSATYGKPTMYQFNEAAVPNAKIQNPRMLRVHPDRVVIWSKDGTVNGSSAMKPGLNDLITIEKIIGAGGEGFWKNAKSSPVLEVDKEATLDGMAKAMGIKPEALADAMNDQVADWQKGFDKVLTIQGMQAKTLQVVLPSPEHFFLTAVNSFAASWQMPTKVLIGNQTGERASTEDNSDWAQTNMGRRALIVRPNIMALVDRLERVGIIPERDWHLDWADLTEASVGEKIERVAKMAQTNRDNPEEIVFTGADMRSVMGMEKLSDKVRLKAKPVEADPANPQGDPKPEPEPKGNIVLPIRV